MMRAFYRSCRGDVKSVDIKAQLVFQGYSMSLVPSMDTSNVSIKEEDSLAQQSGKG